MACRLTAWSCPTTTDYFQLLPKFQQSSMTAASSCWLHQDLASAYSTVFGLRRIKDLPASKMATWLAGKIARSQLQLRLRLQASLWLLLCCLCMTAACCALRANHILQVLIWHAQFDLYKAYSLILTNLYHAAGIKKSFTSTLVIQASECSRRGSALLALLSVGINGFQRAREHWHCKAQR